MRDELTPEQLADDDAARALLRRARAVVADVTGSTPDAQVAEVMRYLVMAETERQVIGAADEWLEPQMLH